jgi:hypothetical protein
VQSSNLRDDAQHHNTEPLAAVALSGGQGVLAIGNLLFRTKYANDATSYPELLAKWKVIVAAKAAHRKWPKHIVAAKVANMSLDHFLNDVCPVCTGRAHVPIENGGRAVLSDRPCPACQGTGTKPLQCEPNWKDYILDMVESLNDITRNAADVAMRKLARDMDLPR